MSVCRGCLASTRPRRRTQVRTAKILPRSQRARILVPLLSTTHRRGKWRYSLRWGVPSSRNPFRNDRPRRLPPPLRAPPRGGRATTILASSRWSPPIPRTGVNPPCPPPVAGGVNQPPAAPTVRPRQGGGGRVRADRDGYDCLTWVGSLRVSPSFLLAPRRRAEVVRCPLLEVGECPSRVRGPLLIAPIAPLPFPPLPPYRRLDS